MQWAVSSLLLLTSAAALSSFQDSSILFSRDLSGALSRTERTFILRRRDLDTQQSLQKRAGRRKKSSGNTPKSLKLPETPRGGSLSQTSSQSVDRGRPNPSLNTFMALENESRGTSKAGSDSASFKSVSTKSWAKSSEQSFKSASSSSVKDTRPGIRPSVGSSRQDKQQAPTRSERRRTSIAHGVGKNKSVRIANHLESNRAAAASGSAAPEPPSPQKKHQLEKAKSLDSGIPDRRLGGQVSPQTSKKASFDDPREESPKRTNLSEEERIAQIIAQRPKPSPRGTGRTGPESPSLNHRPLKISGDPSTSRLEPQRPRPPAWTRPIEQTHPRFDPRFRSHSASQIQSPISFPHEFRPFPSVNAPPPVAERPAGGSPPASVVSNQSGERSSGRPPIPIPMPRVPSSRAMTSGSSQQGASAMENIRMLADQSDTASSRAPVPLRVPPPPPARFQGVRAPVPLTNVRSRPERYVAPHLRPENQGINFEHHYPFAPAMLPNSPPANHQGPTAQDPIVPIPSPGHGLRVGPIGSPKYRE